MKLNMTMEEIAAEMGKLLQTAIQMNYTRGGMRFRYDWDLNNFLR